MIDNSNKYDILNLPVRKADFLCQLTPLVCEREHTVFLTGRRGRGFLLEDIMLKGKKFSQKHKDLIKLNHVIENMIKKERK